MTIFSEAKHAQKITRATDQLIAIGFQPRGNGTLHSPARVTIAPTGADFYRMTIKLPGGDALTCHVAKVALKIKCEEAKP